MGICTSPSVRFILLIMIFCGPVPGQGNLTLYAPNPVDLSSDFHGRTIAIWGQNLDTGNPLEVEWNGQRYPASQFQLTHHPANEITIQIPSSIPLTLGIHTLRLRDTITQAVSSPIKFIVNRATAFPAIPLESDSFTVVDHFWGLWGGEEAVLQQGNINAFVDLFDMKEAIYRTEPGATWGLPIMGYQICSDAVITDPSGADLVVSGDGKPTASGWVWEGCPNWPSFTHNWWAELYPPANLTAGFYTLKLKAVRDGKYSNSRSLVVLPPDAPPFVLVLDRGAAVQGYTSQFPAIQVTGYNLTKASRVYFSGPTSLDVPFTASTQNRGSFVLPTGLPAGDYVVHLGDATGALSNRRPFKVITSVPVPAGPGVTTLVHLNFRDRMHILGGRPDRWVIPGVLPFVEISPGKSVPFFWRENLHNIFYDGQRDDRHILLDPNKGTIEILGYRPKDWPRGRTASNEVFNHGYHHILNLFPQGGDWHAKVRVMVRSLYYIADPPSPNWGDWDVWSYWNDRLITPDGSWTHFEVEMRDEYEIGDCIKVVTDPSFASELAEPIGDKTFDLKFVYDFVDRKEAALYVKVRGQDPDYVDRTYPWSRKIAKANERIDLSPLVSGGFDFGTEKRHPHRILEPSQTAKSNAGGTLDELVITTQGFVDTPRPEFTVTPEAGNYGALKAFRFKVMVQGERSRLNFDSFDVGYLYIQEGQQNYYTLMYRDIWDIQLADEGDHHGYVFTLRTYAPFPEGRYVISVSGVRHRGVLANQAVADFTADPVHP